MVPDSQLHSSPVPSGFLNRAAFPLFWGFSMVMGLLALLGPRMGLPGSWLWLRVGGIVLLLSVLLWAIVRWRHRIQKRGLWYLPAPGAILLALLLTLPRPGITIPITLSILLLTSSLSQEVHQ